MPKIGYGVNDIQARQQAAYNEWYAKYGQPKVEQPKQEAPPEGGAPSDPKFNLPGGQIQTNYAPPKYNVPTAQPYMAQDMANVKTLFGEDAQEPVYYSGKVRDGLAGTWDAVVANPFRNWARRTWAAINNPYDILPSPTPEQTQAIQEKAKKSKEATEASATYDINRFVMEDVFGIKMEEAYQAEAVEQVAKEAGQSVETGKAVRTVKQLGWTAFNSIINSWEWAGRQVSAVAKALDETADEVAGPDKSMAQPSRDIATRMLVANQAKSQPVYVPPGLKPTKENVQQSTEESAKRAQYLIDFSKTSDSINPIEIFRDGVKLIMNLDKVDARKLGSDINRNLAGSSAIYSLLKDDARNAEFERRYAAGEDPQKLAYELTDPLAELMGGILYDPTNFLGGSAAKTVIDETGKRVLKGGVLSATGNAIEQALPEIRMVPEIKNMTEELVKVADGGKPLVPDEVISKVRQIYDTTKAEFTKFANSRNILHDYTAEAKVSLITEEAKDFMHQAVSRVADSPDGMDILTGTLSKAIDFAKTGDEKAFPALLNSPLGQMMLSPRGIKFSNMLAGLDEVSPAIEAAIKEGSLPKLADAYASQIEKVTRRTIMSVEDMRKSIEEVAVLENKMKLTTDPKVLKKLGGELEEAKKLEKAYKALPPHIKFVNGANELLKKPYLMSMSMFSQLYFGLNRFSYPTRNVVAAIPGMAYEFGIKDSLEMATKSITGAQIESVGQSLLLKMKDEIKALTGYVPEAFNSGPSPIGEFVKGSKKILGVVRGGGEVAQLSEQLMGAQIMLKTIKREMRNALKGGAIPSPEKLVKSGLSPEVAKRLLNYAYEYGGDAKKAVTEFRKTLADGGEEVWRHLPLPDKMQSFMESIDPAGRLVKEFDEIRQTAKTADEFRDLTAKLWDKIDAFAESARTIRTNLDSTLTDYTDDVQKATEDIYGGVMRKNTYATPEAIDNFERIVQGFKNAKKAMFDTTEHIRGWLTSNGVNAQDFTGDFIRLNGNNYQPQEAARNAINRVRNNWKNMTSQEIYDSLNQMDKGMFRLDELTEVDPTKVSPREMLRIAWDAYFKWSQNYWADVSTNYNRGSIDILKRMSEKLGLTVEQAAKMSGVNYQTAVDEYNTAMKLFDESQIDSIVAARRKVKDGTTLANIDIASLKQLGYNGLDHVRNSINKYRKALGEPEYATVNDVPFWEVEDMFRRKKRAEGLVPSKAESLLDPTTYKKMEMPPITPDSAPTPARMVAASPDAKNTYNAFVDATARQWGVVEPVSGTLSDDVEKALGEWAQTLSNNVNTVKVEAGEIAKATRNAMLYDYRKKLWNVAAQYISPFHYYHVSASKQWLQNVAADPKWGAIYADYKEYMERKHAGLPDFWKQNVAVSGLPGYDRENPLFFNIEASINPLYQMIGQDFNDPKRRADWLSTTVDDLSKIIPGVYQPLQWLVAANLYRKGEDEAMERWLGRLIPQTKLIKSVTNRLGIDIPITKYNELDPFIGIMDDGIDPYEESRVMRYLANMPGVTEEAKIQAAHSRDGDLWEQAVRGALGSRAVAETASYFLGVGYKPRTAGDIQTDKFYKDYSKLIAARSIMEPDAYRDAWDALRYQYPFMDTLLIGKKAGPDRDTAFAYNVLGRIPPSEMSDISKFVGIEPYMLESFYDNKGDLSKLLPQDRQRFMAAMVDLSAMMKMPDGATKAEWTQAKKTYQDLNQALIDDYGENIIQKMDEFYEVPEADRTDWLANNPQVKDAMADKTAYIANTPILSAYYGGIDTVARYYNNIMYETLDQEFGEDIQKKVDYYYDLGDQGLTKEQKAFKKEMGLEAYFDRLTELQQQANLYAINAAKFIPEGKDYQIRPEFDVQSGIQQSALQYATTDQQAMVAQEIIGQLSDPMQALLQQYYEGGELPYAVGKRLEYLGRDYGLSKQEVLRLLGVEQ